MVKLLIQNGAQIETVDNSQQTPLHAAAIAGIIRIRIHFFRHPIFKWFTY